MSRPASADDHRFEAVDALRGLAMVWMTVFHLAFDLNQFGYIQQDFYQDAFWTGQRTLIVSMFLVCAGMGQALAVAQGQSWARFWRRWSQVLVCAGLVSLGSWLMYPQSFIYFGVLHGLAVMLIIARLTAHWGRWLWVLGALALMTHLAAAPILLLGVPSPVLDALNSPWLNWLGLITLKPVTQDYVPLLPWLGVLWWGVAAGRWLSEPGAARMVWTLPTPWLALARLGRWSLSYYMLHQPVMIGVLMALAWFTQRSA